MSDLIDLRSDVKTMPTDAMRDAMHRAVVGDNTAGNDPTVNHLENLAAEMFGKEAALFGPSGTMCNLLALLCSARPGDEAVIESQSHICLSEVGGLAHVAGLMAHPISTRVGVISPEDFVAAIRPTGLAFSRTGVICLENTHNVHGGLVLKPGDIEPLHMIAQRNGIPLHIDGERVFNAAVALGLEVRTLARDADSITVGLSKGLCAPAGSLLIGSAELIKRAKKAMKMLGGVMRKPGILAAAGIISITEMWKRLGEDHSNARMLAEGLTDLPGLKVDVSKTVTNIVNVDISELHLTPDEFVAKAKDRGLLLGYHLFRPTLVRLVTYRDITQTDIAGALDIIREIVQLDAPKSAT